MTHRITPAEITARRMLMIECKRSQDAAMVGQMQADIKALREALERALNYIENSESELGMALDCGDIARAAMEVTE